MKHSKEEQALKTYEVLDKISPKVITFLSPNDPFKLLISVIMSAQTTDAQVEKVIGPLFELYPTATHLANADIEKVKEIIKSTGFYSVKAKNIIATSKMIVSTFNNKVPLTMEELTTLNGVGRKSANVILGQIANKAAIIVDTHFSRVARRIGLTKQTDPTKIEQEVAKLLPAKYHYRYSMIINNHGRAICFARKPNCYECPISEYCNSFPIT